MTWQEEFNNKRLAGPGWYGCVVSDGWKDLVLETDAKLAFIDPNYKIAQVKEKWGALRFYFDTEKEGIEREIMWAITSYAESRSEHICEKCGTWGTLRTNRPHIITLCDSCEEEREQEYAKREAEFKLTTKLIKNAEGKK